jgi:hypothetical protein
VRPDGVIVVTRAGKSWSALLEAKIAAHPLEPDQINAYLDLARELDFQAGLSVSNQYVTSSTEYPIEIDRRKVRRTKLHHWSWIDRLTQATVQKEYRGISDPDQAYILGELIRYLADPRSGAVAFDGIGSGWTAVHDGAREQTLRKSDAAVIATVALWDDLVRYLALSLTTELGREVKHVLPASERTPNARRQDLTESVISSGRLYGDLQIPNVAGSLSISRTSVRVKSSLRPLSMRRRVVPMERRFVLQGSIRRRERRVWGTDWHVFMETSDFDTAWGSVPRLGIVVTEREIREDPVLRPCSMSGALATIRPIADSWMAFSHGRRTRRSRTDFGKRDAELGFSGRGRERS